MHLSQQIVATDDIDAARFVYIIPIPGFKSHNWDPKTDIATSSRQRGATLTTSVQSVRTIGTYLLAPVTDKSDTISD